MKIENSIKTSGSVGSDSKTRAARDGSSSSTGAASSAGSKVELSSFSSHLQQLEQMVSDTPVVDSGRVAEIKEAIAQGQFRINPEKVADSLLESVRQMLSAQSRSA